MLVCLCQIAVVEGRRKGDSTWESSGCGGGKQSLQVYLFCVDLLCQALDGAQPIRFSHTTCSLNLFQSPHATELNAVLVMPYIMYLTRKLYQAQMLHLIRACSTALNKTERCCPEDGSPECSCQ